MNEWKCGDLKCVQKPTRGRLSLTHPYSRWAWSESPCNQSGRKGKGLRRKGFAEAPSLEFRMKFWASKRWCEMFKLSTSGLVWFTCFCSLPKSLLIKSHDRRPSAECLTNCQPDNSSPLCTPAVILHFTGLQKNLVRNEVWNVRLPGWMLWWSPASRDEAAQRLCAHIALAHYTVET